MPYATDTTTSHDITTDAGFRAWGQAVHDKIAAAGLVQTSDTGQINWATVTTPGSEMTASATNAAGYEVWRFDDALQATSPVFLKVFYGRGDSVGQPKLSFQVGRGSSGAGALTTASQISGSISGGASDAASKIVHAAFVDGAFVLLSNADRTGTAATSGMMLLVIERTRDGNGDHDGGILFVGHSGAATSNGRLVEFWNGTSWQASYRCYLASGGVTADTLSQLPTTSFVPDGHGPLRSIFLVPSPVGLADAGSAEIGGAVSDYRTLCAASGGIGPGYTTTSSTTIDTISTLYLCGLNE